MRHHFLRSIVPCARLAALLGAALTAAAQAPAHTAPGTARRDPLDPKAIVPKVSYSSPFTQYRSLGDDKPISWREANDTVTRIGGWRVYAREAQQPDATPPPAAALPTDPAKRLPAATPGPSGSGEHKTP